MPNDDSMSPQVCRIYVASRAYPSRKQLWRDLRAVGWPIISTWIDIEDSPPDWAQFVTEVTASTGMLLFVNFDDVPLKGALVEIGAALAAGLPVAVVAHLVDDAQLGSWLAHPNVSRHPTILAALTYLCEKVKT